MEQTEYRHEIKHSINGADALTIARRLSTICKPDEHSLCDGGYQVRSLYFDTPTDKALLEKLMGINVREKFRIRIYNGSPDFIRLEKKCKVNGLCAKYSEEMTYEECRRLLAGDTLFLKKSERALLIELYAKMQSEHLRPRTIVDYRREAFLYAPGNVRVTIDSNIRTGVQSTNLFSLSCPTAPVVRDNLSVLEVKYDSYLPTVISDLLQTNCRRAGAFSKYAACRIYG